MIYIYYICYRILALPSECDLVQFCNNTWLIYLNAHGFANTLMEWKFPTQDTVSYDFVQSNVCLLSLNSFLSYLLPIYHFPSLEII
jgi:hypothetical protein